MRDAKPKKGAAKPCLKLGIPKGSLEAATRELFAQAGWNITPHSRNYFPSIDDDEISCALVRAQEMGMHIGGGAIDAGLSGRDWIEESGADVAVVSELVYSKASDRPCRWVLVVAQDSPVNKIEDLQGKRIATELVGFTRRFLREHGVDAQVDFSWGATEAKVVAGLADAAVEITETGGTIRAHGLRIVCDLLHTHTLLVANQDALKDPWKKRKIENIALMLESALAARDKVLLKMNVPEARLGEVVKGLPSLHAPTISKLHGNGAWLAVETVVDRRAVRDLLPVLKAAGAEGILEFALRTMAA
ncbi:MAG: ATP phosphoribosyltransferase [Gammaproteobacteria bacterium]|nr:ATP phosphoribosyltransferase [Gammaproteobacteria bacterium]CAJ2377725.1 MAG: ATP phosphoribosyltransferase [Arenicellales bacterium IbO2]MDA7961256.1 ATP phosphoribosyltransferase [Gammaproteobacteria bacterium]MDA7969398.1 ATP phosphoribosyltransferase [Gammaproteobacteria bacterium]MDA7971399.1 ATP phosphoribosyltransferase [Gammaproteobacteria bacterium]